MSNTIVTVNTTFVRETVGEAREVGQAIALLLGDQNAVKLRDGGMNAIPLVKPIMDRSKITRGGQEAQVTANTIVKNFTALFGLDPALFNNVTVLDSRTREWSVDYDGMVRTVKTIFPGEVEKLDMFKTVVSQVLTAEALRGISLKA